MTLQVPNHAHSQAMMVQANHMKVSYHNIGGYIITHPWPKSNIFSGAETYPESCKNCLVFEQFPVMLMLLLSVVKLKGFENSGYCRIGSLVSMFLQSWKHFFELCAMSFFPFYFKQSLDSLAKPSSSNGKIFWSFCSRMVRSNSWCHHVCWVN